MILCLIALNMESALVVVTMTGTWRVRELMPNSSSHKTRLPSAKSLKLDDTENSYYFSFSGLCPT